MRSRFSDVTQQIIESYMLKIHTCIPGKIESYDPTLKKASVKPLVKFKVNNELLSYPVIDNVPVIFPTTQNFRFVYPLNNGDGCIIFFSEQSLENWLSSSGEEVEPGDNRRYSVSDAFCVPGLFPFGNVGKTGDTKDVILEIDNSNIIINGDTIELNGNTKRFVTYAELNTAIQTFITALNSHTHAVTTAPGTTGPVNPPSLALDISTAETQTVKTGG